MTGTTNAPSRAAPAPATTRLPSDFSSVSLWPQTATSSCCISQNRIQSFNFSLAVEPENFLNRVLLVADNATAGAIIREQLSAAGYDVHWARNRVEAGVLWQPSYYDVVLLDLRRDPSEGEDFAHRIRATDPGQRIIFLDGRDGTKEAA